MPRNIRKRGKNSYEFNVAAGYENGKQILFTETFKCESDAEAKKEYAIYKAECLKGKVLSSADNKLTMNQFYDYWVDRYAKVNLKANTIAYNKNISKRILHSFGNVRIDKITPQMCTLFIKNLKTITGTHKKPLSPITIKKYYILLNELFNYAYKWDLIKENPMIKLDPPSGGRAKKIMPPPSDVSKILTASMKEKAKYRLWVFLAFAMGLRREEIFGLKINDIDFKNRVLTIQRAAVYVPGKGVIVETTKTFASERKLFIPDIVLNILNEYIPEIRGSKVVGIDGWLFKGRSSPIIQPQSFNEFLERLCDKINVPKISPHTLRHLYGSNLIKQGIDLALTSHQLGHVNKSFTADTYIHVTEQIETRAASAIQNTVNELIKT